MTDKIIKFPTNYKPNFNPIPVNKVLLSADSESLEEVIVLGKNKNGEIKIFSSESNVEKVVFLCEYAKTLVTKSVIGNLFLDIK